MRFRLQLFLPLAIGLLLAAGFLVAAASVADGVRQALLTVPGLTRERAVEMAVAAVMLTGTVVTALCVIGTALLTRMIVKPLRQVQREAARAGGAPQDVGSTTPLAEIQDLARGVQRVAGELHDRHGRERQERSKLTVLLESVSEGILQVDERGRIARVNPAGRALLGLPPESMGRPVASLLRDEELRRAMERGVSGASAGGMEIDLDERRILASVAPLTGGGAVATLVDLTDLRRLEEVRRDFVANASHELKTPLTSIRGYADTLLGGDVPEGERRQFLEVIARNAARLQRIVDDLLDLSRIEAGRWQPVRVTVPVLELAESCWASFSDRAEERSIRFVTEADGDDQAVVDRQAMEQIFANLFDNALRYTPEHGRVRVATRVQSAGPPPIDRDRPASGPGAAAGDEHRQAGSWIVVEVSDTGAGIPRDVLPRIFERFYRADPARSRAEGGTGLGLSIVKHMVESMGGAIRAESVLGRGTTFRLWLRRSDS